MSQPAQPLSAQELNARIARVMAKASPRFAPEGGGGLDALSALRFGKSPAASVEHSDDEGPSGLSSPSAIRAQHLQSRSQTIPNTPTPIDSSRGAAERSTRTSRATDGPLSLATSSFAFPERMPDPAEALTPTERYLGVREVNAFATGRSVRSSLAAVASSSHSAYSDEPPLPTRRATPERLERHADPDGGRSRASYRLPSPVMRLPLLIYMCMLDA